MNLSRTSIYFHKRIFLSRNKVFNPFKFNNLIRNYTKSYYNFDINNNNSNNNANIAINSGDKYNITSDIWTIPNIITFSRIAASPGLVYAIANDMKEVAFGGCIIFAFTDWLDGYIARNYNQMTKLGAILDPLADKIFIGSLTLGLCMKGLLPPELAGVYIGRDVAILTCAFAMKLKQRHTQGISFFDTSSTSESYDVVPSVLSKVNTGLQLGVLTASLGHFCSSYPPMYLIEPFWYITAVTSVASALGYADGSGIRRR
jgi:cardiolipin synthase